MFWYVKVVIDLFKVALKGNKTPSKEPMSIPLPSPGGSEPGGAAGAPREESPRRRRRSRGNAIPAPGALPNPQDQDLRQSPPPNRQRHKPRGRNNDEIPPTNAGSFSSSYSSSSYGEEDSSFPDGSKKSGGLSDHSSSTLSGSTLSTLIKEYREAPARGRFTPRGSPDRDLHAGLYSETVLLLMLMFGCGMLVTVIEIVASYLARSVSLRVDGVASAVETLAYGFCMVIEYVKRSKHLSRRSERQWDFFGGIITLGMMVFSLVLIGADAVGGIEEARDSKLLVEDLRL